MPLLFFAQQQMHKSLINHRQVANVIIILTVQVPIQGLIQTQVQPLFMSPFAAELLIHNWLK